MSVKHKRKKHKSFQSKQFLLAQASRKYRPKKSRKHKTSRSSSTSAPSAASLGSNLLKQYKASHEQYTRSQQTLPTKTEIAWNNFIEGLDQLPEDLRVQFTTTIDWLRMKYGDAAIAHYLESRSLLQEMSKYSSVDYKSIVAITYLYQLAAGLEILTNGTTDIMSEDLKDQAEWMISSKVKPQNQGRYEVNLTDTAVIDISLTHSLDEYVDSVIDWI